MITHLGAHPASANTCLHARCEREAAHKEKTRVVGDNVNDGTNIEMDNSRMSRKWQMILMETRLLTQHRKC
jgi:hypothetical protein